MYTLYEKVQINTSFVLSHILIYVMKGAPRGSRTMISSSEVHSLIGKYIPWNIEKELIRTMAICLAL